ncbi:PTS system mannose/fructose/N-acetylgalactosamine-transporter subunit IIB [Enterococcus dongliensis]|uniref:PTS system mannose/fructose/N-acetylgalactosamine-transporter subunit IIB n=1 Tax=Enterococcus dongliensis TaxID=2559925 RepID=UPI00288D4BEA|nr:PTS sugar transporter subunit IIB [Enterococcus dongliensis]MDT2612883.1 PTS sugar transporter subunit IIB [Enterococcus dongliensis]
MGQIKLGRVDHRLIHGQVMTKWSKGLGINAIFVIEDSIANDDFMKDIFINSGAKSGIHVEVYSQDEAIKYWEDRQFDDYSVIILFQSIKGAYETIKKGLPVPSLNIGGVAKKKNSQFVIPSAAIVLDEYNQLKELQVDGVDLFFQTVPDSPKVSMNEADKKFS